MHFIHSLAVAALAIGPALADAQTKTGQTTRYWDCCKASCGWSGKANVNSPVKSCDKSDNPIADMAARTGCDGGGAFMCAGQSPWAVNDNLAYGFAAAKLAGMGESNWCCACYELTFTSGPVNGKKMVVQVTNTGGDLGDNHFDLQMPGGGVGLFNGCTAQWGAPANGWGERYGGIKQRSDCDKFPEKLKPGCYWRFDWFKNADNPNVSFKPVTCPAALTDKTGCKRN